ncbi:MAG TPA: type II toxin-antitoxin system PemK/MazF family toxin [Candidatus Binataceae bacterium]|nr:type II toxin-antitoxin system PemK/MazF family toxin [Candidatus Binataceae bacterium]
MPNRGEVWLANLNPKRGAEPAKLRPVLIVQAQVLLDESYPSTLIIPLTTNTIPGAEPLRIGMLPAGKLRERSDLLIDQMRAIDNRRLIEGPLVTFDAPLMAKIGEAIKEVLDLTD